MRPFSLSTLAWLGGLASSIAILSLIAAGEESGPPKATERVADVTPAAFSTGDGNPSASSGPDGSHGREARAHGPPNSNLSGERTAARLDSNWSFDKIGSRRGSDDFGGEENPLPALPVNGAMVPQDAFNSAYPDAASSQFPSFPASASGNAPNGSAKSASDSTPESGYFVVVNGGGPGQPMFFGPPRAVPEPSSWALGCVAMAAVIYLRRRAARP